MQLRPYQRDAIAAVGERWRAGDRSTLLVMPTGCGKTIVFADIARRLAARGGRSLVVAHRTELLDQAAAKLRDAGVHAEVEQADRVARADAPVVVASVQTLRGRRLARFDPDAFDAVILDESHRSISQGYRDILKHFATARVLGVTATPDRLDGIGLHVVFDSVAYRYELADAIRDGWLAPLRALRVHIRGMDLSSIQTRAGDLAQDQLGVLLSDPRLVHGIARALVTESGRRRTMAFAVNVAHAYALAEACCQLEPGSARAVHGEVSRDERATALRDFREGRVRILINCALWTEGFDEPSIECVGIARPTKSRSLLCQMIGRGTRTHPGKGDCLVLDFTGSTGRHQLATPVDVLAGAMLRDDERAAAERALSETAPVDVAEVLARVRAMPAARVEYDVRDIRLGLSADEVAGLLDVHGGLSPSGVSWDSLWE